MMNAISRSSTEIKDKIKGTVLFGYTQNRQTQGTIPNYPKDRLKVFCTVVDGVCDGTLIVTPGHYAYSGDSIITEASQFLLKAARTWDRIVHDIMDKQILEMLLASMRVSATGMALEFSSYMMKTSIGYAMWWRSLQFCNKSQQV